MGRENELEPLATAALPARAEATPQLSSLNDEEAWQLGNEDGPEDLDFEVCSICLSAILPHQRQARANPVRELCWIPPRLSMTSLIHLCRRADVRMHFIGNVWQLPSLCLRFVRCVHADVPTPIVQHVSDARRWLELSTTVRPSWRFRHHSEHWVRTQDRNGFFVSSTVANFCYAMQRRSCLTRARRACILGKSPWYISYPVFSGNNSGRTGAFKSTTMLLSHVNGNSINNHFR